MAAEINGFQRLGVGCLGHRIALRVKPARVGDQTCLATSKALDFVLAHQEQAGRILEGKEQHTSWQVLGLRDSRDLVFCDVCELEPSLELQGGFRVTGKAAENVSGAVTEFLREKEGLLTPAQRRIVIAILLLVSGFKQTAGGKMYMDETIERTAMNSMLSEDAPIVDARQLRGYLDLRITTRPVFDFVRDTLLRAVASAHYAKFMEYEQAIIDLREILDPLEAQMREVYEDRDRQIRKAQGKVDAKIIPLPLGRKKEE